MTHAIQVLLATHNGIRWLDEQIRSILDQEGVQVQILASDDRSSDGTAERLRAWSEQDSRVSLLPAHSAFGSAAASFYHLLRHADTNRFALVALADQDDIWERDKLRRHAELLLSHRVAGVSSDVEAFWADGRTHLIRKAQAQRRWDHLLEPPGPGCTFLMDSALVDRCVEWLDRLEAMAHPQPPKHDWFIYLLARCSGRPWYIDARSSVRYRQHESNEVGANAGIAAIFKRLSILARGGYHIQVRQAIELARLISAHYGQPEPPARLSAWDLLREGRRRRHEALIMALFSLRGV